MKAIALKFLLLYILFLWGCSEQQGESIANTEDPSLTTVDQPNPPTESPPNLPAVPVPVVREKIHDEDTPNGSGAGGGGLFPEQPNKYFTWSTGLQRPATVRIFLAYRPNYLRNDARGLIHQFNKYSDVYGLKLRFMETPHAHLAHVTISIGQHSYRTHSLLGCAERVFTNAPIAYLRRGGREYPVHRLVSGKIVMPDLDWEPKNDKKTGPKLGKNQYHFSTALAHELGHILFGFSHNMRRYSRTFNQDRRSIMFPFLKPQQIRQAFSRDEMMLAVELYGSERSPRRDREAVANCDGYKTHLTVYRNNPSDSPSDFQVELFHFPYKSKRLLKVQQWVDNRREGISVLGSDGELNYLTNFNANPRQGHPSVFGGILQSSEKNSSLRLTSTAKFSCDVAPSVR